MLKTDNAKEYFALILGDYILSQGIVHQSSCVDIVQQNGVVERKNSQLLEVFRSLMFTKHVLNIF